MILKMRYLLNKNLREHSEKVFEGISNGRKKALDNWFKDQWAQIENIKSSLTTLEDNDFVINNYLLEHIKKHEDFCEIFILDNEGIVSVSSCKQHIGLNMSDLPNLKTGLEGKPLMYGPYIDKRTLDTDISNKKFVDDVTLMFSCPCRNHNGEIRVLCCRVLNDDMSNVIQDEDTHIYKDSGDNYLFMVKSNRGIKPGTAISRSRFEDNTFTLGENLKDGIRTKSWGNVRIKEHTEFEILFNDPATNTLHKGVDNTIKNGQNLDCWPGYSDYRHIMVGGKGTLIKPPNCEEVWGMMCEGDIDEIYNFQSINFKIPLAVSIMSAALLIINAISMKFVPSMSIYISLVIWIILSTFTLTICRKMVVSPLSKTIDILQDIAEGEGNLTKRVKKMSSDEIGELSRWFNKFINNQMSMLDRVKKSAKTTKKSVNIVSEITNDVKNGMGLIENTVVSLLENSQEQNVVFQDTKNKFSEISASIQEMDSLVLEVSGIVEETNDNASVAQNASKEVIGNMKDLEITIGETVNSINTLQGYSKKISEVVNVISNISKQTQLLALNASIEAARAGESGKGFSVVAGEISKLASETEEATKSISNFINQVQGQTQSTFEYAGEINSKIIKSTTSVKDSMKSFNKINKDINIISDAMKSITQITSTQSESVGDVMNNVSTMADRIEQSTESSSNKSEKSLVVVEKILDGIKQLKQATEVLEYSSDNLNEMVGSFKLK
ncbi:methyl-accepting chemotaxis protein [Clostridium saccharobutylicum]|uniref:Putative sensory transducer protein YvaQ n=1 Tax=Clostridium saccharobutylicum DSM 13864 TaxID=1345695 RepID=U5MXE0_CLOSA|nr:methyl-accepting chemotaxis protein [Clostridium saccharobutylicum]AGX45434.1 putative sensory transducer protein YvaQ [Clostridium saccharobutylicum DSM 13864]AQR92706.1 methyl-accepting chemotaxis protein PctA [Clostridium saccharobutylicum]AQS02608.1 methyl-accepting chemotaxis protein PctA [Clostridium saccharobutylicum]AQS16591.1 methyl-accepting chemotaxis protein PctA [Clostridium saccharobutylicum]MBA2907180.1 methyl-accepting chemotaxis protein [Clostridium saccharobutylicum]